MNQPANSVVAGFKIKKAKEGGSSRCAGASITETARRAGVRRATLYRWLKAFDPDRPLASLRPDNRGLERHGVAPLTRTGDFVPKMAKSELAGRRKSGRMRRGVSAMRAV
jgi:hypothetical protein